MTPKRLTRAYVTSLEEQLRGARKRNNNLVKASKNSHNGMLYWKDRALRLQTGLVTIDEWINKNVKPSNEGVI